MMLLLTFIFLLNGVVSEVYTVGDDDQWESGISYFDWSEKYNFTVGDVLVFKYVKGQHNAYEVTEKTYQTCNTSTGVLAKYESGNDEVNLTEAKKYWFICDKEGHCLGGMRFGIQVKEKANATGHNQSPPPPNNGHPSKSRGTLIYLLALGFYPVFFLLVDWDDDVSQINFFLVFCSEVSAATTWFLIRGLDL
ncbi:hypothetical protein NMG60_11019412 [Bertholletia excelsa]